MVSENGTKFSNYFFHQVEEWLQKTSGESDHYEIHQTLNFDPRQVPRWPKNLKTPGSPRGNLRNGSITIKDEHEMNHSPPVTKLRNVLNEDVAEYDVSYRFEIHLKFYYIPNVIIRLLFF